jgi:hypothetical protein
MGKASRKHQHGRRSDGSASRREGAARAAAAPYVARPFEGLPGETDWVALREILPSATAAVTFTADAAGVGLPQAATIATVLPMAWPAMHRADGEVFVSTQSGSVSGDASRDLAAALLAAAAADAGEPVATVATATAETPRLQDLIASDAPFEATAHDGFGFWVSDTELDDEAKASLDRANESVIPTVRLTARPSAYVQTIGERSYLRWVLPFDEDAATDGLARLVASGGHRLGADDRLLGAFRACGLLIPVWEVDSSADPMSFDGPLGELAERLEAAVLSSASLTVEERRARSGLLSRQVTLR